MSRHLDENSKRVVTLLRVDSYRLFERIESRVEEYMKTFALKRTRNHFNDIFKSKYWDASIKEMTSCSQDLIVAIDNFYSKVDEMNWYLNHTEEMPNMVRENVNSFIRDLDEIYNTLSLYFNGELGPD